MVVLPSNVTHENEERTEEERKSENEENQPRPVDAQIDFDAVEDEKLQPKRIEPKIVSHIASDEEQTPVEKPEPAQPAPVNCGKSSRSSKKRNATFNNVKPAKSAKIATETLFAPSKSCELRSDCQLFADVTDTEDSTMWSIEPVCENGIRLGFSAKEPNAASVIRTLFETIYKPVLATLRMEPLEWDNLEDHEIGRFLTKFNTKVRFFLEKFFFKFSFWL
ncbi:hypothetical protein B9Z55_012575 [Caenorhabditis nigoni]|nr:hypothetical protein B9Z55_012575 [Caenorhabditis nigoni]